MKSALVVLILIYFEAVSADPIPAVEAKRLISAPAEGWDFFFGSCSWYCGSRAIKVASSSFLTERDLRLKCMMGTWERSGAKR